VPRSGCHDGRLRSYEAEYVNSVWHGDGATKARCRSSLREENTETPVLIGILDDRSRLACHLQWYPWIRACAGLTDDATPARLPSGRANVFI